MLKLFYFLFVVFQFGWVYSSEVSLNLMMPDVSPKNKDSYLCRKFKLDDQNPIYITEFEANSTKAVAHHILLFACDDVTDEDVWNCGEMNKAPKGDIYKTGPICQGSKQSIIFAWALDAPKLVLPKDVAFKLGGNTDKKYLVMQVHYADVEKFKDGSTDRSGLKLKGQTEAVSNVAGVYLLQTGGSIQSQAHENFEAACEIQEDIVMHPFAYRTHAHKLGLVNSGYVVKHDQSTDDEEWTEIGRRSPQLPQMFFPASNKVEINKGDVLAARCTMYNFRDHTVNIGATGEDEMCNFYIMYYVSGDKLPKSTGCFTYGPPYWHFKDFKGSNGRLDLDKIPKNIGTIPEEQEKEMSDMENHPGMHSMHGSSAEASSQESNESRQNQGKIDNSIISQFVNEYGNQLKPIDEKNTGDEYVDYLNELEREFYLRKLLKKLKLN